MEHFIIPEGYTPGIDLKETQVAIKIIKDFFQKELAKQLNLTPRFGAAVRAAGIRTQ